MPDPAPSAFATIPDHVAILGLGPSVEAYFDVTRRLGGRHAFCDETWAINALGDVAICDRIFHMDDVRVQQRRAAAAPGSNIAAMLAWLKTHPGPIYTSHLEDGYPGLVAYPLEDVLNDLGGIAYFNSTAAYAVAFAVHLGVKRISLFGCDFTYPNSHQAEQGRGCVEFYLGIAKTRGIVIGLPNTTSLMDGCATREARLYGYDGYAIGFDHAEDGALSLTFTPRDLPTAAEIEARYDHSQHPNPLVAGQSAGAPQEPTS